MLLLRCVADTSSAMCTREQKSSLAFCGSRQTRRETCTPMLLLRCVASSLSGKGVLLLKICEIGGELERFPCRLRLLPGLESERRLTLPADFAKASNASWMCSRAFGKWNTNSKVNSTMSCLHLVADSEARRQQPAVR